MTGKMKMKSKGEVVDEVDKVRSTLPGPSDTSALTVWFSEFLAENPNGWLFVSVNISGTNLRLASEFASRSCLLGSVSGTRIADAWITEWDSVWNKFFEKLRTFELAGFARKRANPIVRFVIYENSGKRLDPKACPSHTHMCVRKPDDESMDAFVRRFCSAFNNYVYPLKVTADSEWIWDVKTVRDGAVLVIVEKRDDELSKYMTKQLKRWGDTNRINLRGLE